MILVLLIAAVVIAAATVVALNASWRKSGWLVDREHAINKIDQLVDAMTISAERFSESPIATKMDDVVGNWPTQRSELISDGGFKQWFKAGRPAQTYMHAPSQELFQFARAHAGPLTWSLTKADDLDKDLTARIEAVVKGQQLNLKPKNTTRIKSTAS